MTSRWIPVATLAISLVGPAAAGAQTYEARKPRRHFVTLSLDWLYTQPLHFANHPLQDLLGTEVAEAQFQDFDYETRDKLTRVDVLEFNRRGRGLGITIYPLGMSAGPTLGIRGSAEDLPVIRMAFDGPGDLDSYTLADARAYDVGAGLFMADLSPGWGLGSHAFVIGGVGRVRSDLSDGSRYFAEGGGGINSGPIGVELSVKFAWNMLDEPVRHKFLTVPITLRGTLTF
jgi:hypothetical protein